MNTQEIYGSVCVNTLQLNVMMPATFVLRTAFSSLAERKSIATRAVSLQAKTPAYPNSPVFIDDHFRFE